MEERRFPSQRDFPERVELGRDPQQGNTSRRPGEPSLLEEGPLGEGYGPVHPIVLKVRNSIERGSCLTFVTPFSRESSRHLD